MAAHDPETRDHRDWLKLLQEESAGLVVAVPAMTRAEAIVPRNSVELHRRYLAAIAPSRTELDAAGPRRRGRGFAGEEPPARLDDFPRLARDFLGWEAEDLVGGPTPEGRAALPPSLEVALTEYQQVLAPTWAVPAPDAPADASPVDPRRWLMLIVEVDGEFDDAGAELPRGRNRGWHASPQNRLERLLHDTGVPIGLLVNHRAIRLVYAPGGESSGYLTFPIAAMAKSDARLILGAFHMLLGAERLFTLPDDRRLPTLLAESRKYQSEVSTKLSEQVLRALGELLRGFVAADDAAGGALLREAARLDPQHIYGGLLTALMRLVFLLYAEERELMPKEAPYSEHYAVTSLFERLRADADLYVDTMDQRYGAWARLLSLFRLVHDGGAHGPMRLPARRGELFNPDTYPFLEGRPYRTLRVMGERISPPRIADGVVYRVLEDLLLLDGERLSYRTLDVEQIGSVYEAIMGFEVRRALAPSIALRPDHVVVDLAAILAAKPAERAGLLEAQAACKVPRGAAEALKQATTIDALVAALGSRVSPQTPTPLAAGALYLQPTEERRRSGSHYTPRTLTEPIVETTLRPVLEALGARPTPEQILDLKVCDPAMGSGAFLVETCRYLGKALVAAWAVHDATPNAIPPDEDVTLHARRLIAQRCLYGVDKNPFAVSLAKLSLWLVTLAKDHPFTFINHALRPGDSLVGLTRQQIAGFHWIDDNDLPLFRWVADQIGKARSARDGIILLGDEQEDEKRLHWREAEEALEDARLTGDLVISAFFAAAKDKDRLARLAELRDAVKVWRETGNGKKELEEIVDGMRSGERPVVPLHWEIEFPEVFDRRSPGFDVFVGNPPFLGGAKIWPVLGGSYRDFLHCQHEHSGGKAVDLVAHFFRRAFALLRVGGALGLIATNTIAQGDSRQAGLAQICQREGRIFEAQRRVRWPGLAAVSVSIIHIVRCASLTHATLDGRSVRGINSHLLPIEREIEPVALAANAIFSYRGSMVYGMGFTFDDGNEAATPLSAMEEICLQNPAARSRIRRFVGGEDINSSPLHSSSRFIIDFSDLSLEDAQRWPALLDIVRAKVKPERDRLGGYAVALRRRENWWQFGTWAGALRRELSKRDACLVVSQVSAHHAVARVESDCEFSHTVIVFPVDSFAAFATLQARPHELWSRFLGSSLEDRARYTPSDCFDTFPLPLHWLDARVMQEAGEAYYTKRALFMLTTGLGLTKTYNRFHDPDETDPEILKLRELHDAMDRAVLAAYGWSDLDPRCEFLLDYEDDADDDDGNRRKKPWRYRWPDALQEEVLARLLALNQERAEEERLAGLGRGKGAKAQPARSGPKPPTASSDTAAAPRPPTPATATSAREPAKANASAKRKPTSAKKKATKKAAKTRTTKRAATTGQAGLFGNDED